MGRDVLLGVAQKPHILPDNAISTLRLMKFIPTTASLCNGRLGRLWYGHDEGKPGSRRDRAAKDALLLVDQHGLAEVSSLIGTVHDFCPGAAKQADFDCGLIDFRTLPKRLLRDHMANDHVSGQVSGLKTSEMNADIVGLSEAMAWHYCK